MKYAPGVPAVGLPVRGTRVLVGAVNTVLLAATSLGLARGELLDAAGLREDDLVDRDAYVPFARQIALGEAMVRARPDVNLGLGALRQASTGTLGVLGYVVSHSATLRDALDAFVRFQTLITDGVRFALTGTDPIRIGLEADPVFARMGHPIEALAGIWVALGRKLTLVDWKPECVSFQHAPQGDVREHERFFGVAPAFRAKSTAIAISRATMDLPIAAGKPALRPSMIQLCESTLADLRGHGNLTERVRAALLQQVPSGIPSKTRLARSLAMSERTLNRRLEAEGSTYRDVLDDVRRELALAWLTDPHHAVYEVAFLLGYTEPSTFHRSFRRWTGVSPLAWRKTHAR